MSQREREGGQEDKQVWQVCVTVHNYHAKLMQRGEELKTEVQKQKDRQTESKRERERARGSSYELLSFQITVFIMTLCQQPGPR